MRPFSLFLFLSVALLMGCASTRLTDVQLDSLTKCPQTLWHVKSRLIQAGFRFESESESKLVSQWKRDPEASTTAEKRGDLFLKYEITKLSENSIQWKEFQSKSPSANPSKLVATDFYGDAESGVKSQRIARERVCGRDEFQYPISK